MNYLTQTKKFYRQVRGLFPEKLPTGVGDFDRFIDDLRSTYFMPTEDRPSIVFSVANMIMHLGPEAYKKSKFYFYRALHAGASKQVAAYCFTQVKENAAALERAKQAEATAPKLAVAPDVPQ